MFYQIFFSPQVKRLAIITYKDGIYELPHDLPHEFIKSAQPPPIRQNESPVNTSRKTFEKQKLNFPVVRYFTRKLELVSNILWVTLDFQIMWQCQSQS